MFGGPLTFSNFIFICLITIKIAKKLNNIKNEQYDNYEDDHAYLALTMMNKIMGCEITFCATHFTTISMCVSTCVGDIEQK